jgi:hypothetical protein
VVLLVLVGACSSRPAEQPPEATRKPADAQHAGITTPHGDHTAHHGGVVLMNGEVHYEVVFDKGGRHRVWFSDAVREDLPASVASNVKMIVTRSFASPEFLTLTIDDSGESWIAAGRPIGGGEMVTLSYSLRGAPLEIEIPVPK